MTTLLILPIIIVLLCVLALGSPVFSSIGFTASLILVIVMGWKFINQFGLIAFSQATNSNQLIAPLFVLMAALLAKGGIAEDIYYVLNKYLKKLKGGLAISTTLACTVFAAICGSSPATAASIGKISVEEMVKRGYKPGFAAATVAAGGTLGVMIPPSVVLVGFGILTETSISKLLVAGLIPGLVLAALLCVSIVIRAKFHPELVGLDKEGNPLPGAVTEIDTIKTTGKQDIEKVLPVAILIVLVFGTMYTGVATAIESASIGVVGAFIILFIRRRMNGKLFKEAMMETTKIGVMILFMMIAGFCLTYVVSYMGIASNLATFIANSGFNRWVVMILLYILWYILGCLMDTNAMIVLTIPFVFEMLTSLGFDPLWIGVVSTLCVEIGMITPPVGLNLFVLKSATNVKMTDIIKGAVPYVIILTIGLVILSLFPILATWLPSTM